jgi:hypothetical protein
MRQPDVRYAAASREWGLRRVRRLTWTIAGTGTAGALVLAFGFGGHVHLPRASGSSQTGQASTGSVGSGSAGNQVPAAGGGQLQPPAANPQPGLGGGQVMSGGS